jgi:hypothetical protein
LSFSALCTLKVCFFIGRTQRYSTYAILRYAILLNDILRYSTQLYATQRYAICISTTYFTLLHSAFSELRHKTEKDCSFTCWRWATFARVGISKFYVVLKKKKKSLRPFKYILILFSRLVLVVPQQRATGNGVVHGHSHTKESGGVSELWTICLYIFSSKSGYKSYFGTNKNIKSVFVFEHRTFNIYFLLYQDCKSRATTFPMREIHFSLTRSTRVWNLRVRVSEKWISQIGKVFAKLLHLCNEKNNSRKNIEFCWNTEWYFAFKIHTFSATPLR